jgi:glucosylglycerate synthase
LLNSSVISPLVRSLYGKRIRNPMGPDLGVSKRLFQRMLGAERAFPVAGMHPLASLAPTAVCDNLKICEVHVGARVYPAIDWANISSLIAQVLDPVFLDMDRNAACWQRIRGSAPVAEIGTPVVADRDAETVNIDGLVEWFQLGNQELQEIWGLVLPPATLFELRKLSRLSREQFHMPDQLWVRSIYDFALAHRLQIISRDHLLKSITPLYLGWVASYAKDLQAVGGALVEQRLERLSLTYEAEKPYLVSRWRWPDRFSP